MEEHSWIEKAAKRLEKRNFTEAEERAWARHVAGTLRGRREEIFAKLKAVLLSTLAEVKKALGVNLKLVEATPFSLTIRKENNPGLRITVEIESSGRGLKVTEVRMANAVESTECCYFLAVCLSSSEEVYFRDGDDKLDHVRDVCRRLLQPVVEILNIDGTDED